MDQNGSEWIRVDPVELKLAKVVWNFTSKLQWIMKVQIGSKWTKIVWYLKMVQNYSKTCISEGCNAQSLSITRQHLWLKFRTPCKRGKMDPNCLTLNDLVKKSHEELESDQQNPMISFTLHWLSFGRSLTTAAEFERTPNGPPFRTQHTHHFHFWQTFSILHASLESWIQSFEGKISAPGN